jgi:hypothetical protein
MICREIQNDLPDYVTGELAEDLKARIRDHLSACPSCSSDAEQLKLLFNELNQLQPAAPSPAYWSSLLPRIHARLDSETVWSIPIWIQRLALPTAAAIVLFIVAMNIIPHGNKDTANDVQGVIQQLQPEELQEVADQQTVAGVAETALLSIDRTLTVDSEVLKEILQDEDHRVIYADLDASAVTESITDQDSQELVSILEHTSLN